MMRRLGGLGHPDFERDLYELARQHLADRAKLRTFFERPQPDRVARYFRIVAELERQETGRRRRAWLASLGGSLIRFLAGIALSGRARPEVRDFADAEPGFGRVRWSNRRRRSRRGKKLARIAAVASLSLMVAGGGLFAWAWHHSGPLLAAAEANLTCGNAIRLVDIVGRTTALLPADGCRGARQHLTAPFDDADLVSDLAAKVGSIEGAWRVEETFLGQDLVGVARKIASELGLLGPRGATGPLQSAFESLAGSPHAAGFFEKVVLVVADRDSSRSTSRTTRAVPISSFIACLSSSMWAGRSPAPPALTRSSMGRRWGCLTNACSREWQAFRSGRRARMPSRSRWRVVG